ncbi:hypothetical protein [Bernardetia sp. MNP-M8]|uniref:hypothetical protein n=1 Tax=Bernardetia sp. MNP-M8 TaxID=3127470 RepID=UPI0030CE83C4
MKSIYYFSVLYLVIVIIIHITSLILIDTSFFGFSLMGICQVICIALFGCALIIESKKTKKKPDIFSVFEKLPSYFSKIAIGLVMYVVLIFFLAIYNPDDSYDSKEGIRAVFQNNTYQLRTRYGKFIKNITEEEYHLHNTKGIRVFSAAWILFGGLAVATLYKNAQEEKESQK